MEDYKKELCRERIKILQDCKRKLIIDIKYNITISDNKVLRPIYEKLEKSFNEVIDEETKFLNEI